MTKRRAEKNIQIEMAEAQKASGRGERTTWAQAEAMIEWLEIEKHYRLITGVGAKDTGSVTAGAKVRKTDAYSDLEDHVNPRCGTSWTRP